MSTKDMRSQTIERIKAWNLHSLNAFAAFYAADATVYDPMYPQPLQGRDAIRQDFEEFTTAFPDAEFTPGAIIQSGDTVAFELTAGGTHTGPLAGPGGPIPATNRRVIMPIAAFARIDSEGLVAEERRYFDVASLMQQLGLVPA